MKLNKYINIFMVSSLVSLITISYLGLAYLKRPVLRLELLLMLPLLYGLFGIINYKVVEKKGWKYSFIVGSLFGLLLSLIGRFRLNLPTKLFNFTKKTEYKVHIYAIILYAGIFQFIITPLTQKL